MHAAQKTYRPASISPIFCVLCAASPRGLPGREHKQRRQQKCIADLRTASSATKSFHFAIRYRADCRSRTERVKSWNAQAIIWDDLSSRIKLVSEAKEVFNAIGIDGRLNFSWKYVRVRAKVLGWELTSRSLSAAYSACTSARLKRLSINSSSSAGHSNCFALDKASGILATFMIY